MFGKCHTAVVVHALVFVLILSDDTWIGRNENTLYLVPRFLCAVVFGLVAMVRNGEPSQPEPYSIEIMQTWYGLRACSQDGGVNVFLT